MRIASAADVAAVDWPPGLLLLADSRHPSMAGGTGVAFAWDLAADLALRYRLMVGGGLAGDNVGAAVRRLRPWGVDASSRLESSPGIKDAARVREFVRAARAAEAELLAPVSS
jgi:phosphoribosylanthranilate isomerase